jgi:hypothetical protein
MPKAVGARTPEDHPLLVNLNFQREREKWLLWADRASDAAIKQRIEHLAKHATDDIQIKAFMEDMQIALGIHQGQN